MIMMTVDSPCSILGQLRRILMRENHFWDCSPPTDFTDTVFHQEPSSLLDLLDALGFSTWRDRPRFNALLVGPRFVVCIRKYIVLKPHWLNRTG